MKKTWMLSGAMALATAGMLASASAQDNRVPLNYRGLTVTAFEVNNNQRRNITGAQVTITAQDPGKDQHNKTPATRTTGTRGASFGQLPPSSLVGPYEIKIVTRDCGEQTKSHRMSGGSDHRVQFTFSQCGKSGEVAREMERRSGGGNNLTVSVKDGGRPGAGFWVYLKDSSGQQVAKIRTGGSGEAKFQKIAASNYEIEVKRGAKLEKTITHQMPDQDSSATIQLQ